MYTGDYKEKLQALMNERGCIPSEAVWKVLDEIEKEVTERDRGAVHWCEEDFAGKAKEMVDRMLDIENDKDKTWKKYYDEKKFSDALDMMINKHDCETGINWYTVEFWLDNMCRTSKKFPHEK